MYNEELKMKFAEDGAENNRSFAMFVFSKTEKYEKKYKKDLCQMDEKELSVSLKDLSTIRSKSVGHYKKLLSDYAQWCIDNKVRNANDNLKRAEFSNVEKLKRCTLRSPAHLQRCLDAVYKSEEREGVENTVRCAYWMSYSGIMYDDLFLITSDCINLSDMTISYKGFTYPIFREAIPCIKKCMELKSFRLYYNLSDYVYVPRYGGNILIRGTKAPSPNPKSFSHNNAEKLRKARADGKLDIELSFYSVWLSGLFFRTYMDEMDGFPVDFSKAVDEINTIKGLNPSRQTRADQKSLFGKDYKAWKTNLFK